MNFFDAQSETFMRLVGGAGRRGVSDQLESAWKVLIFDDFTFNIVSNFKVGDLREANVTLHLHIKDSKEELNGVEAIYFISPSQKSVDMFISDLERNYFDQIHLNFCSFIDKAVFQAMTQRIITLKKTTHIKEIRQYNLDFYPLTSNILTFGVDNSFGNESREFVDTVAKKVMGLVHVLNEAPVIFYDKNSSRLDQIFESLNSQFNSNDQYFKPEISGFKSQKRTVILLWEGSQDTGPFFVHEFKYFPLIVDSFQLFREVTNFNNIKIDDVVLHVDLKNDSFWQRNRFEYFPTVLENIHNEVSTWKEKYDKLNMRNQNEADLVEMSENFNEALESLPQMTEQNKINQNHLNIAKHLMREVERKNFQKFGELGSEIFQNRRVTRDHLIEIYGLFENKEVSATDKIRLLCVINYCTTLDFKEYEKLEGLLRANATLSEAEQRLLINMKTDKYPNDVQSKGLFEKFKSVSGNILKNVMAESVKCKVSNVLLDVFRRREIDGLKIKTLSATSDQLNLESITQVVIVAVDGGCLREAEEMTDLSTLLKRDVVYACSQLLSGGDVVNKLAAKS
jgi:hypothetical protein